MAIFNKPNENREQFYCVNGNDGPEWQKERSMPTFDKLPRRVRLALAQSPFNICPACFETVLSVRQRPDLSKVERMLAAIKIREGQIRRGEARQCW
jgi:hypothetical protein